jgi:hypothetical protein
MDPNILALLQSLGMIKVDPKTGLQCRQILETALAQHAGQLPQDWEQLYQWVSDLPADMEVMLVLPGIERAKIGGIPFPKLTVVPVQPQQKQEDPCPSRDRGEQVMANPRSGNGPVTVAGHTFNAAWIRDETGYKLRIHEDDHQKLPSLEQGQQVTIQPEGSTAETVWVVTFEQPVHHRTISLHLSFTPPVN